MKIIGLTGGIASGKSTVSKILKQDFNLPIVDADLIAREIMYPDGEAMKQIIQEFGMDFILMDGNLNRPKMGQLISNDLTAKKKLEEITHPLIYKNTKNKFEYYEAKGEALIIYDCPLLFEVHQENLVDEIIVVVTQLSTRIERLVARDGITEEEAIKKIEIQLEDSYKIERANAIIYNDGSLEDLAICVRNYGIELKKMQIEEKSGK